MASFIFTVSSQNGTGTSDLTGLNNVIAAIDIGGIDAGVGNSYTINIANNVTLSQDLSAIALASGASLTVNGNGHAIEGKHTTGSTGFRGFMVLGGTVTLQSLT